MLHLNVADLLEMNEDDLSRRIENAGGVVQLAISVPDLYQASSKTELAENWLKVWYTAERLAEHAQSATCTVHEGDLGAGDLVFNLAADNVRGLAADLMEFGAVYGGDDLEAAALIYDEAEEWLRRRGDSPTWFPGLEENYRNDAAQAADFDGYGADDDMEAGG